MPAKTTDGGLNAELVYFTRAPKAPTMRESITRLAERARADSASIASNVRRRFLNYSSFMAA